MAATLSSGGTPTPVSTIPGGGLPLPYVDQIPPEARYASPLIDKYE